MEMSTFIAFVICFHVDTNTVTESYMEYNFLYSVLYLFRNNILQTVGHVRLHYMFS